MKLAWRELLRRPGRFGTATVILLLIALLLMFLGGLVDGLIANSTGAVRAQSGEGIVFSATARDSFLRSRIEPALRTLIEAVPGVSKVGGIGIVQLGARLPGKGLRDLVDVALFGTELPPKGVPGIPATGEAYADRVLQEQGVTKGMTIVLGPARSAIKVIGFVDDTNYLGQGAMWANPTTWRSVLSANRPGEMMADGVFQSLIVVGDGHDPKALRSHIDAATNGLTTTLSVAQAASVIPGVKEQKGTFGQIIAVTLAIAVVVIALFFALLTVERTGLYGVLKALGASSRTLFAGVVLQAVVVTLIASVIAGTLSFALDAAIPAGSIPFSFGVGRLLISVGSLLLAAIVGCAFSLRRVLRIDPAQAIGGSL